MAQVLQTGTHVFGSAISAVFNAAVTVVKSVGKFFEVVMIANSRTEQLEQMHNLTDVELATKYGINRDQIVAYVFRDRIY